MRSPVYYLSFLLFVLFSCGINSCTPKTIVYAAYSLPKSTCEVDWFDGKCTDYPNPYDFIPLKSEPKPDSIMLYKRLKLIFPNSTKLSGRINIRMFTTAKDSLVKAAYIESTDSEEFNTPTLEAIKFLRSLPALDYPDKPINCWSSYPIYFPIK